MGEERPKRGRRRKGQNQRKNWLKTKGG